MKCAICNKVKGKRICLLQEKQAICSRCCAEVRGDACEGCSYYAQAEAYAIDKAAKGDRKHFTIEINPEVENAVHEILQEVSRGRTKKAEADLQSLHAEYPDNHMIYFGLGTCLAVDGRLDAAIECFDRALEIFPYFVDCWVNKGMAHSKKVEFLQMINAYGHAVEYGPADDEGVAYARKILEAMDAHERENGSSLERYVKGLEAFDKGYNQLREGKYDDAIVNLQRAADISPHLPQPYGNMGLCYGFLGQKKNAIASLEKALEIDPKYELALANKVMIENGMDEGVPLKQNKLEFVKYYAEYGESAGRSYIRELIEKEKQLLTKSGNHHFSA